MSRTGSTDDLIAALRESGRRITAQRRAILEYLTRRTDHPSPRQIYRDLSPRVPSLSLATVYNTLKALVEMGLIREIDFEAADNRYDPNLAPHINLVCVRCGSITDFDHELPIAPEELRSKLGFETVDFRIEYRGLCAGCRTPAED